MTVEDVKCALSAAGIETHDPGERPGICTSPYVVVRSGGTYAYAVSGRVGYTLIEVHGYVPLPQYAALDALMRRVMAVLAPLAPDLRPTGSQELHTINDKFKAHESTVEYMVQKRLF